MLHILTKFNLTCLCRQTRIMFGLSVLLIVLASYMFEKMEK
jgi:hypothetical protein